MISWKYPWGRCLAMIEGKSQEFGRDRRTPDEIAMEKSLGRQVLQDITGQDFGEDAQLWRKWVETHPEQWYPPELTLEDLYSIHPELKEKRAFDST